MGTIVLRNNTVRGGLWVEVRFSNGGASFFDLPLAPGFPMKMEFGEPASIAMHNWKELLYRFEVNLFDESAVGYGSIYRLIAPTGAEVIEESIKCD